MNVPFDILLALKYLAAVTILVIIVLTPAWLARQTGKSKQDMILVRLASWIFGWTGIGWLWSLFWSAKK